MRTIDLNADVGEGAGDDARLIPLVTSANIACGAHAGDDQTMADAVRAALMAGVAIGAHPGHADRQHFGRQEHPLTTAGAAALVVDQVGRLRSIAQQQGGDVAYVKLHGALYHQAGHDPQVADGIVAGVEKLGYRQLSAGQLGRGLALLGQPGSALEAAANASRVRFFAEAFADRRYEASGVLRPRNAPGALIDEPAIAAEQAVRIAIRGEAVTHDGHPVAARCDSVCLHGDSIGAVSTAFAIREALATVGVKLRPFSQQ